MEESAATSPPRPIVNDRFVRFLLIARWASALVALMYHLRFLLFVNYDAVQAKTLFSTVFYFVTGLGHESYAVFFVLDGILAGLLLHRHRSQAVSGDSPLVRHVGSLYQILLPGLIVGATLDLTGARFFGGAGVYTDYPELSVLTLTFSALFGNALMLQPFVVPNFGSNSMLYLPSYLFWSLILLAALVRLGMNQARGRYMQLLLLAAVALMMPYQFLIWAGIWGAGVGLVFLTESRGWRPPLLLAASFFAATLVLSRLMGMRTSLLPEPFGDVLIQAGFALVGIGFACVAWALYPKLSVDGNASRASRASRSADGWSGQTASFTFFCHFPVIMLLASMGSALLGQALMQQPTLATYGRFACLVGACIVTAAVVMRVAGAATKALSLLRRPHV